MEYKKNSIQLSIAHTCIDEDKYEKNVSFYDVNTSEEDKSNFYGIDEIIEVLKKHDTYLTIANITSTKDAYVSINVPYDLD